MVGTNVIVTGSAGYIGRHVCHELRRAGWTPIPVDIADPLMPVDVLDTAGLRAGVDGLRPVGVIHLAAHSDVTESVANPAKYAENVAMVQSLLAVVGRMPAVLASSAALYGKTRGLAVREDAAIYPANPYGESKWHSESLMYDAMRLRFFNVAGGPRGRPKHLIPQVVDALINGREITVYGDGTAVRDFVHVEDAARAAVLALEARLKGIPGQPVNICSGRPVRVSAVINRAAELLGVTPRVNYQPGRAGEPEYLVGLATKAKNLLKWKATTDLDGIIRSAAGLDAVA